MKGPRRRKYGAGTDEVTDTRGKIYGQTTGHKTRGKDHGIAHTEKVQEHRMGERARGKGDIAMSARSRKREAENHDFDCGLV